MRGARSRRGISPAPRSGRAAQIDRAECPSWRSSMRPRARQFEHRREGRGKAERRKMPPRTHQVESWPARATPAHGRETGSRRLSASSIEWTARAARRQNLAGAPAALAIGAQKFVQARARRRDGRSRGALRHAAREHIPPEQRPRHKRRAGALHRRQHRSRCVQRRGQLLTARPRRLPAAAGSSRRDFRYASQAAMTR